MKKGQGIVIRRCGGGHTAGRILSGIVLALVVAVAMPSVGGLKGMMPYVEATAEEPYYDTDHSQEESVSDNTIIRTSDHAITDDDRAKADEDMLYYMQSLEVRYILDAIVMENLHKVFESAVY